ncbi:MAG TPA: protein-glutamate O-methyltransferase CheR [Candidatus Ozemobacteraceae bacterium]|nr:protein-glutamate O-methyltransferase CheR [Candidatus Ozemobacteraceae bacterium]
MIRITPQHRNALAEFVREYAGILLSRVSPRGLDGKIAQHAEELGFKTMDEYLGFLESGIGARARDELMSRITVGESFFFRNPGQFRYLARTFLPEVYREKRRLGLDSIRIWSAACATGEEAYSLAYVADWFRTRNEGVEIEVFATDINQRLLEQAKAGEFRGRSFRRQSREIRDEFEFPLPPEAGEDACFHVGDRIRRLVRFQIQNLKDAGGLKSHAGSDIIMCRNVLIYFDEEFRQRLVTAFHGLLNPGGMLFLGETESLPPMPGVFELQSCNGAYGYRKITTGA